MEKDEIEWLANATRGAGRRLRQKIKGRKIMKSVKFGVCGIGRIGQQHCRVFSQDRESYELVALCDLDPARVSSMTVSINPLSNALRSLLRNSFSEKATTSR